MLKLTVSNSNILKTVRSIKIKFGRLKSEFLLAICFGRRDIFEFKIEQLQYLYIFS